MERVTSYVEARHFRIGDLYAFGISVGIEFATDRKPFFCRGVGDQRDCDVEADERNGAPVRNRSHPPLHHLSEGSRLPCERRAEGLRFGANAILRLACLPDSPRT